MELDWDVFLADFGDSLLEYELRLVELEYDDGEAIVSWELEKVNDQLGGISYVVLVVSPQQTVEYHEPDPRTADSQTMRVEAEPGDTIDVILHDTLNTDYEPGDGVVGPGDAQVGDVIPDDAGGGDNGDDDGAVGPEPGPIEIVSCDTPDQVVVGESAVVTATVENIGAAEGSGTVVIEAGGAESSTDVTLAPGERTTVAVGFEFDDAGDFPVTLELR